MFRFAAAVAVAVLGVAGLTATAQRKVEARRATGFIAASAWPYFPGSVLPVRIDGLPAPYHLSLVGEGTLRDGGVYAVGDGAPPGTATLVAGNAHGLASRSLRIGAPPQPSHDWVAVASYDEGLVVHDARDFSVKGLLAIAGAASDAAFDAQGRVAVADTDGSHLTVATLHPWTVTQVADVPLADELAIDGRTGNVFVTNRDVRGGGALTRVTGDGRASTVATGQTAEGLVIDERRQIVYVANTNDGTVAAVDARTMRVLRRFPVVDRVFSLALSADGNVLYAVSNQSAGSPFGAAGSVVAVSLAGKKPRVVARSANLTFPIGLAFDRHDGKLLVTDESDDVIDVLSAKTLHELQPAIPTCHTPWKPLLDERTGRLYVPCARADSVDVFDVRTLRRVAGAPFKTGGYPLAVSVWHARPAANRPPQ